jgi:hypothetical protein
MIIHKEFMQIYKYFLVITHQTDEDQPHGYTQTFVLKPIGQSFFVQHDIFRLALHDMA